MWWPFARSVDYYCPRCDRAVKIKPMVKFDCPRGKAAGFTPCCVIENYYALVVEYP